MTVAQDRTRSVARATAQARRDGRVLTPEFVEELDALMGAAFQDAQAKVPVRSRSLKNSGRSGTDVRDDESTWIGYMAWGGASAPKDVDYSVYVMAAGGEHDWLRDAPTYNAAFEAAIEAHLRGHLG